MLKEDGGGCAQRSDSPKKACATGACPLSNANTLAFFVPFAIANAINYAQTHSAASGPVCDTCVISQLAPGILAGCVGMAIYHGVKFVKQQISAKPVDNLPIQADYMEKAKFSTAEFEAEKSRASSK